MRIIFKNKNPLYGCTSGFIFIKDCDNYFKYNFLEEENQIAYCSLDSFSSVNPGNKSYIRINKSNIIEMVG